jgi:hypothetical protein
MVISFGYHGYFFGISLTTNQLIIIIWKYNLSIIAKI